MVAALASSLVTDFQSALYLALKEMHQEISPETVRRLLQDIEEVQRERPSAVELWLKEGWIWQTTPGKE